MRGRFAVVLVVLLGMVACTGHTTKKAQHPSAPLRYQGITFATPSSWRVQWTAPGCQADAEIGNDTVTIVRGESRYLGSCLLTRLTPANLTAVVITSFFSPLGGQQTRWHGARAGLHIGAATKGQPATASLQLPDQNAQVMIYAPSADIARSLLNRVGIANGQ